MWSIPTPTSLCSLSAQFLLNFLNSDFSTYSCVCMCVYIYIFLIQNFLWFLLKNFSCVLKCHSKQLPHRNIPLSSHSITCHLCMCFWCVHACTCMYRVPPQVLFFWPPSTLTFCFFQLSCLFLPGELTDLELTLRKSQGGPGICPSLAPQVLGFQYMPLHLAFFSP